MSQVSVRKMRVTTKSISLTAVFTALTCTLTMVFMVYVPATKGYFNVSEIMVYMSALLLGPFIGAFVSGVGTMLADLLGGYYYFAPATLLIKALEALTAGWLGSRSPFKKPRSWRIFTIITAITVGFAIFFVGTTYLSGYVETYLGFSGPYLGQIGGITISFTLPDVFWGGLASVSFILITVSGLKADSRLGWTVASLLVAGSEMITGYFIYENFILGQILFPEAGVIYALGEVPINIGQMSIGIIASIPLVKGVKRALAGKHKPIRIR